MNLFRIALANIRFPGTPEESITLARQAIDQAASRGTRVLCFPEGFTPGYRGMGKFAPPPSAEFLERAWSAIAAAAAAAGLTVMLGTERLLDGALLLTALVINADGSRAGFQDKVQIDPSEEGTYAAGVGRQLFHAGPLTFGIVILSRRLAIRGCCIPWARRRSPAGATPCCPTRARAARYPARSGRWGS